MCQMASVLWRGMTHRRVLESTGEGTLMLNRVAGEASLMM